MGRGRKSAPRGGKDSIRSKPTEPKDFDPRDAKINAINSWEDVADEVDDFHAQRDKILLDGDDATRARNKDEAEYTDDEEEVFALDDSDTSSAEEEFDYESHEDEDQSGDEEEAAPRQSRKAALSDDEDEQDDEEEVEGWGTSKSNYYGADEITNEQDALDEEVEARRIQSKQLASMSEADFLPDIDDWNTEETGATGRHGVELVSKKGAVTETLPIINPENLSAEERMKLLHARNPEFELLAKEFITLQGQYEGLALSARAAEAVGDGDNSIAVAKFRALSAYLGVLAMYFAIFTSDGGIKVKDHGVMEGLVKSRSLWERVSKLESDEIVARLHKTTLSKKTDQPQLQNEGAEDVDMDDFESESESEEPIQSIPAKSSKPTKQPQRKRVKLSPSTTTTKLTPAQTAALAAKAARLASTEANLSDLSTLIHKPATTTTKKTTTSNSKPALRTLSLSDFADPTSLSTSDLADKSTRKDALRFHASQLLSKSARRTLASRTAGGDDDVPHRERNRDRSAAVVKHNLTAGADLDDNDTDDEDRATAAAVNDPDLEYYNQVAGVAKSHKTSKKDAYNAVRDAKKKGMEIVRTEAGAVGADGKRAIGYTIEKNKGLTPHRKKDVRNPRVKKRKKYESAKIKLASKKAIYKPLAGAYGGEATGIKKNLVKSVKLK